MVRRSVRLRGPDQASVEVLGRRFERIRDDLEIARGFPEPVVDEARRAAEAGPEPADAQRYVDLDDVPFVTVDPPGATDLDQALHLQRRGSGYRVRYAIADVPAFVGTGSAVDAEARRRGQTLYAPDVRVPLHPKVISEDAASLLEGQRRAAFVWVVDLDEAGAVEQVDLVRAQVRSRRQLDYRQVQQAADRAAGAGGTGGHDDPLTEQAVLLREIGERRQQQERQRGGASLPLPDQEVQAENGRYRLELRPAVPAEDWNAQLSLLTGMSAARIMLDGGVGLLRTMPAPDDRSVARLRRQARALGVHWPKEQAYGEMLRGLRRDVPGELALMYEAVTLFRGAGYTPFGPGVDAAGEGSPAPEQLTHAAVAAPYAHVTAPLRRLVDRFGLLVCHTLVQGETVPEPVVAALADLPAQMSASDALAGQLDRRCTDVVEAAVLAHRVGEVFEAVVVDEARSGPRVQLTEPAVLATATGTAEVGAEVSVRLTGVDLDRGRVDLKVESGR